MSKIGWKVCNSFLGLCVKKAYVVYKSGYLFHTISSFTVLWKYIRIINPFVHERSPPFTAVNLVLCWTFVTGEPWKNSSNFSKFKRHATASTRTTHRTNGRSQFKNEISKHPHTTRLGCPCLCELSFSSLDGATKLHRD